MPIEILNSASAGHTEIQRLLDSASRQPWGPGREIDAKVHQLHQALLTIGARLGTAEERPDDKTQVEKIEHELRNKLTVFRYYEEQRQDPKKRDTGALPAAPV